ncbi:tetraspanin-8-like [Brachyhypopomus gauderio]|uniref:tetraspanin-8-like n=1 Tax=Brachyhypopomus gauderio TaxID=698409 RepID=UPI0040410FC5
MAKINPCFKKIFVFFNVLFAVFGLVIVVLGGLAHAAQYEVENKMMGVIVLYVIGGVTFLISALGAYGAHKENKYVLIAFFTIMCSGCVILFRIAIPMASSRLDILLMIQKQTDYLLPLERANPEAQQAVLVVQDGYKCCGLFNGYQDWGRNIPDSCNCGIDDLECVQSNPEARIFHLGGSSGYRKPCGPIVMEIWDKCFSVILGVIFGLAALALLGAVMSLAMIVRVSASAHTPPYSFSVIYEPPKYTQIENIKSVH